MIGITEPLFWLIALSLAVPWGGVVWLGIENARLRRSRNNWRTLAKRKEQQEDHSRLLFEPKPDRENVVELFPEQRNFKGSDGGPLPRVVDIPFRGTVNDKDRPGAEL